MNVRIKLRTRKALDKIAASLDQDRAQQVDHQKPAANIDVQRWHRDHIRQGLREANEGKFAPAAEVNRILARLRKK